MTVQLQHGDRRKSRQYQLCGSATEEGFCLVQQDSWVSASTQQPRFARLAKVDLLQLACFVSDSTWHVCHADCTPHAKIVECTGVVTVRALDNHALSQLQTMSGASRWPAAVQWLHAKALRIPVGQQAAASV